MSPALSASQVTRRFGGVVALNSVSLSLEAGTVHGLIGPNGSGKTTLLNILCGYYRVDEGRVELGGRDISREPVQARPAAGIGRTFQAPRLLNDLSTIDNVMAGGWSTTKAGFLAVLFGTGAAAADEIRIRRRAEELVHGIGLGTVLDRRAGLLDHAEQRFTEIARALMARPSFLLLDEPASGLSGNEIDMLAEIIRTVRDQGIGVLLVEHHTDLVFRVSDVVTALDFGKVISSGLPRDVRGDANVKRIYLGG